MVQQIFQEDKRPHASKHLIVVQGPRRRFERGLSVVSNAMAKGNHDDDDVTDTRCQIGQQQKGKAKLLIANVKFLQQQLSNSCNEIFGSDTLSVRCVLGIQATGPPKIQCGNA